MEQMLAKANDLRESEAYGEFAKLYTDCLLELLKINDPEGLVHCLGGQSLIYKIKARETDKPIFHHLASSFAKEAYEVGEANKDKINGRELSIAYSSYADTLLSDKKIDEALPLFQKALEVSTAGIPERGRLKAHIGGIKYFLGEKEIGINLIKEALADIRTGDPSVSTFRIWETGALNGLATIYAKEGNIDEAKKLAQESLKIATEYNLPIRKKEIEEIISKISIGDTDFSV